jgi:hypothetical protein
MHNLRFSPLSWASNKRQISNTVLMQAALQIDLVFTSFLTVLLMFSASISCSCGVFVHHFHSSWLSFVS